MKIRKSSRLILINEKEEIFLFLYDFSEWNDQYNLWITPGGGAEPGETEEETLQREVQEELGITIDKKLPLVYTQERVLRHLTKGELLSKESFYLMYCEQQEFDYRLWTEEEKKCMTVGKWWSQEELDHSEGLFFTERIGDWFRAVRNYDQGGAVYSQGVEFTELQMKLEDFSLSKVTGKVLTGVKPMTVESMNASEVRKDESVPVTGKDTLEVIFRYAKQEDDSALVKAVEAVDKNWVKYFTQNTRAFVAEENGVIVGFTILDNPDSCILSREYNHFGSVGCVGVIPAARNRGIGLAMVAHATEELKKMGCTHSAIHYTYLEQWYQRLGYQTYMKYCFLKH